MSESNETYKSYENCIYTKDGKSFFMAAKALASVTFLDGIKNIYSPAFSNCHNLTNVIIPDSVSHIDPFVFSGCTNLTNIRIPDGVASILGATFSNCNNLKSVTIPTSVTSIGNSAFSNCSSLTTVNFKGSEEQWNAIKIYNNNDPLKNATVEYNYTGE